MQRRALMLQGKLDRVAQTFLDGIHLRVPRHDRIHLVRQDLLHQIRDVAVVVVKCLPVDAAPLHDQLHRDLVQRPLVQQCQKCLPDGPPRLPCHALTSFPFQFTIFSTKTQKENARRSTIFSI